MYITCRFLGIKKKFNTNKRRVIICDFIYDSYEFLLLSGNSNNSLNIKMCMGIYYSNRFFVEQIIYAPNTD